MTATEPTAPASAAVPTEPATRAPGQRLSTANAGPRPSVVGFGTATPANSYTQREMLELFGIEDPRIRSVFLNSAIERRYLTLPPELADGTRKTETQGELLAKHKEQGVRTGREALETALKRAGLALSDVGYLCCVTTTGLLTPGFSAHLVKEAGLPVSTGRLDVVGMGCNAGLNAMAAVASWSAANPGQAAVMVCAEVCSAAYVFDGTMRTSVVNSLFGDGAAAVVMVTDPAGTARAAHGAHATKTAEADEAAPVGTVLKAASRIIPEAVDAMRYDWDDDQGKFSFFLDRDVPYVVGANAEEVVDRLLGGTGLERADIDHWLVHSGGKKVIDSVKVNLGLSTYALRHTTGVLRDYGNLSSGSFLFSYERLMEEGRVRRGDYGVLMTMGPGSTIETALLQW
ncbi:Alpha-pyrone synthesis polyketide synthase-like Pks11 [Streptomyces sp. S4.7]|uniref:3,5-dihydroxyphenylacetyl-CoA synthase DpgA n=1 Tax=Streptomyces sp. S4.7 TaxID=2705439 RepID=UPI001398366D|nr:3,5-dihydroxyphenylacetyl-CoA synthase DpgA [Streptomyces sp. S4.7]QHY94437.1 Alpha-pyrone synthesis polyketide synthase-like Pks11 [Streptomyces sp. S4.7]